MPTPSTFCCTGWELAISRDRVCTAKARGDYAAVPTEYRIAPSRLVTSLPARRCFPCTQTVVSSALRPFLDGDYTWRIDTTAVQLASTEQRRQSHASQKEQADANRAAAAMQRHQWSVQLQQNATDFQSLLPSLDQSYKNALQQGFGRAATADDEQRLAINFATPVTNVETGVATEQWFIALLRRRLTTYRPGETRLRQPGRVEILDLELVRGLRGEVDVRVQMLSGQWYGLQVKTLSYIDGSSYQFGCTDKWSPNLLIAATDNTYQRFALLWARDTYGDRFTVTFGVEAATAHTAKVVLKTDNDIDFINWIVELLPQSVATPHSRPAGSMMILPTWMELLSLQFIGAKCMALGVPWVAANRADAAYDLVINHTHRVQVKASTVKRFHLSRDHWDRDEHQHVIRPYRATDFDFLLLVLLPSSRNPIGPISSYVIPMGQLQKCGLVSFYNEEGVFVPSTKGMYVTLYPEWERFREAWALLQ